MWYLVAPLTADQVAVTEPSARVRLTLDGVAGGDWASAGGGEYERGEREGQERGKPPRQTRERKRL